MSVDTVGVDTSVFIAILLEEDEGNQWSDTLRSYGRRIMAAATYLECAIVSTRRENGRVDLDAWLARETIEIVPIDHTLARLAADGFTRFGKGRHPAGLNYGDCFAYALAESVGAPLLFKGMDFARTDCVPA